MAPIFSPREESGSVLPSPSSSPSATPSPYLHNLTPHDATTNTNTPPTHQKRLQLVSIPATYADLTTSLAPGAIAGIILGSVAGFLILLYLISLMVGGDSSNNDGTSYGRSHSRSRSRSRHYSDAREARLSFRRPRRSRGRRGVTEVVRTVKPGYAREMRERERGAYRRPVSGSRSRSRARVRRGGGGEEMISVEESPERVDDGGSVVEVYEEEGSSVAGGGRPGRRRARSRGSYR